MPSEGHEAQEGLLADASQTSILSGLAEMQIETSEWAQRSLNRRQLSIQNPAGVY